MVFTVPQGVPQGPAGPPGAPASPVGYGGIRWQGSIVAGGSIQPFIAGVPTKVSAADANMPSAGGVIPQSGASRVIVGTAGIYLVYFSFWFAFNPTSDWLFEVRVNGAPSGVACRESIFGFYPSGCEGHRLVQLTAGAVLELYATRTSGSGSSNMRKDSGQIYVERADP